ncbi:hypothetical protein [Streptosporangium sp. KLBMP 9127]|nr:hypothetical protein [Streptosporangium sp. KLBMP 9127]
MLMLLWDHEMASEREMLATLNPAERLALAVAAIEWTLETMSPPIQDGATLAFLERALTVCRQAVAEERGGISEQPELVEDFDDVYEGTEEPGTAHLLSAVMECCEASDGLHAEGVYNVLSYCYEGSMDREEVADLSVDAERNNRRCTSVILYQRDLIRNSLIHGGREGF